VRLISQVSALFLSRSFVALSSFILAPWYVQQLGTTGFGVVALFTSLLACMVLFDMGLSTVATTHAAKLQLSQPNSVHRIWLARAEKFYWLVGMCLSLIIASIFLITPSNWIMTAFGQSSPSGFTGLTLGLACLSLALTWPQNYYSAVATGLQRQTQLAHAVIVCALLKIASMLITLFYFQSFLILFATLALNAALQTFWLKRIIEWRDSTVSDITVYWKGWRHELSQIIHPSLWAISAIGTVLTQGDKLFLSAVLSVDDFAAYAIAALLCTSLYMIMSPLYSVFLPYFVRVLRELDQQHLRERYLLASGLTVVLVLPAGVTLAAFSEEILSLWLKDQVMIQSATAIVPWLAIGSTVHGLLYPSYALQLAAGWTQLALRMNLALLCVTIPLIFFSANRWGGAGAAACWMLLNIVFLMIWPALVHRKLLLALGFHWYVDYVVLPALAVGAIAFSAKLFFTAYFSGWTVIGLLLSVWLICAGSVILVIPFIRQQTLNWVMRKGFLKRG
jgi:O-antigen/teichoic acid export membrane protein